MARINFVLQGKGGVGKSLAASLITQFLTEKGEAPLCLDTDPTNATFSGYKSFNVQRLEIMKDNDIDPNQFDNLMQLLIESKSSDIVIDNGASSFIALSSYIISNGAIQILQEMGHEVIIHTVITGGQAMYDTLNGFNQLAINFPENTEIVVWLNEYFGEIEDPETGKQFEDMKVYQNNKERINGIVRIHKQTSLFNENFEAIMKRRQTFQEAIESPDYNFMSKNRLKIIKSKVFEQLAVGLGEISVAENTPKKAKASSKGVAHAD